MKGRKAALQESQQRNAIPVATVGHREIADRHVNRCATEQIDQFGGVAYQSGNGEVRRGLKQVFHAGQQDRMVIGHNDVQRHARLLP
ncbi:hypothetical protein D3C81_1895140 [compost metagenome]